MHVSITSYDGGRMDVVFADVVAKSTSTRLNDETGSGRGEFSGAFER